MWSQTRSMSATTCEATTTVAEVWATPSISSFSSSRPASGSRLANGSSSSTSCGRFPSTSASASRARSPSESAPTDVREGIWVSSSETISSSQCAFVRRTNSIVSATLNER